MPQPRPTGTEALTALCICAVAVCVAVLTLAGMISAVLSGHRVPHPSARAALASLAHVGDPSIAWRTPVGPPVAYWAITVVLIGTIGGVAFVLQHRYGNTLVGVFAGTRGSGLGQAGIGDGLATWAEVARAAGRRALLRRSATLRPSLAKPRPVQVGFRVGRSRGLDCWTCTEDSTVILGPPRSGKGLHLVIAMILDAPGSVITTSTRPDNLAATLTARAALGPVAVFDPQRLTNGTTPAAAWSPARGCQSPQVAMARAHALCADPDPKLDNASFWSQQCHTAVRCLLHAAAIEHRPTADLLRWSVSPIAALDAVDILTRSPADSAGWRTALDTILNSDPRQRDSVWSMVANVFAPLADPHVLHAVSPAPGQEFDPADFLRSHGTLYLIGTSSGAAATANLVTAFVEDILDTGRHLAAASPGARLDPPLSVILDEAANYPLPSLPSLMSDGGGSGISTTAVLQSLAQARARWGEHDAQAIWDAAIVKLILGGSASAEDLRDLSALMGTRQQPVRSDTWSPGAGRSTSASTQEAPVLDVGRLRTLPFGTAILLLRSAPPIDLRLQPWTRRRDAAQIKASRVQYEAAPRVPHDRA